MRKVILGVGISLDGYIARPDGAVDFLFMPKDYSMAAFFASVDTFIMGRKTLDAALRMGGGGGSFGGMPAYVLSRSQPAGERDGLFFTRESPARLVTRIRRRPGKHIWMMGGGELARAFLAADLIDELYLGVVPVLLGEESTRRICDRHRVIPYLERGDGSNMEPNALRGDAVLGVRRRFHRLCRGPRL